MIKKQCTLALLCAFLSVGMLSETEASKILRPNISVKSHTQTEQQNIEQKPQIEVKEQAVSKPGRLQNLPVVSNKPVPKPVEEIDNKVSEPAPKKTASLEEIKARLAKMRADRSQEDIQAEPPAAKSNTSVLKKSTKKQAVAKTALLAVTPESKVLDAELAGMLGDKGTLVPGIGVIAYKNGEKVYENTLGRRYIFSEPTGDLPFTTDSRFRIATISQQIVALATMQLAGQGKLNLDEDISKYLGFTLRNPNNSDVKITIHMLMNHTSGLRDAQYDFDKSWQDIFATGKGFFAPKDQKPGEYFHYANINYRILATILEKISGLRFDLFMKNGILKDLNFKGGYNIADFKVKEQKLLGGVYQKQVNGVWNENNPWSLQMDDYTMLKGHKNTEFLMQPAEPGKDMWVNLLNYEVGKNASMFVPECGLRASLEDLSHVLEMIFAQGVYLNKQVIDNKFLDEMFKIHWVYDDWDKNGETFGGIFEAYGYGVMPYMNGSTTRLSTVRAHQWWGQIGDNYGVVSGLVIDRRTKSGYVYLANGQAMNWSDARSRGKFSKHIIWQENINDAVCRNLFKD